MQKTSFEHGGVEYDKRYPDGIPTSLVIEDIHNNKYDSGLVMYPAGHARNTSHNLQAILEHKFKLLGALAVDDVEALVKRFQSLQHKNKQDIAELYNFKILNRGKFD